MKLRVFGITDRSALDPLADEALSSDWQNDPTDRWIDVDAATREDLITLLAPLNLHEVILAACLQPERSQRFVSHRTALYMEVPTHHGWNQDLRPYVSVLCLKTTIITIHRDPQHTIEDIIRNLDADVPLYAGTSAALLYYLLTEIGKCNLEAALETRAEAERLDQACHTQPDKLDPVYIAQLRRRVSHYASSTTTMRIAPVPCSQSSQRRCGSASSCPSSANCFGYRRSLGS